MTERDFAMALAVLAEAFGEQRLTPVRIGTYRESLADIPLPLLQETVRRAVKTRTWFPKVSELRQDAEVCRLELIAAHPYDGCVNCEDHRGWAPREIDGVTRMVRCSCWRAHKELLAGFGIGTEPLALPAGREVDA